MEKKDIITKFIEDSLEIKKAKENFIKNITDNIEQIIKIFMEQIEICAKKVKEAGKENISYMHISLLKVDMLLGIYKYRIQIQNNEWYMDKEQIIYEFILSEFFMPLIKLKEELLEKSRQYIGKINKYDINNIIFEEADKYNEVLIVIMREAFYQLDKEDLINKVTKEEYFIIRMGEFRGESEIIYKRDNVVKNMEIWNDAQRGEIKAKHKLIYSCWNDMVIMKNQSQYKDFSFAQFKKVNITNGIFNSCEFASTIFIDCEFNNCLFINCSFNRSKLINCQFINTRFDNSIMKEVLCQKGNLLKMELTEEQLKGIYVYREL